MKITRIDRWLIESVFQPIVDMTGKQPASLARNSLLLSAIILIIRYFLVYHPDGSSFAWLVAGLAACGGMVFCSYLPYFHEAFAQMLWLRLFELSLLSLNIGCSFIVLISPLFIKDIPTELSSKAFGFETVISMLFSTLSICFVYFAACKPPRPRAPRWNPARLKMSGSAPRLF